MITGIILTTVATGCSTDSGISWKSIPENTNPAGEIVEFSFDLNRPVQNPYDVESIHISMNVWQQQGDTLKIPAFFYLPYKEESIDQSRVQPGDSTWKVRFTPKEGGTYYYNLEVVYEDEVIKTGTKNFQVIGKSRYGFMKHGRTAVIFIMLQEAAFFPPALTWHIPLITDNRSITITFLKRWHKTV